jgi:HPt (histidine-containing phosphotransfer) domain-containing protein
MAEPPGATPGDRQQLLAELQREFARALPDRLAALHDALDACTDQSDHAVAERFYFTAHALMGTAASYGATELVDPAGRLARLGQQWLEGGIPSAVEIAAARDGLMLLEDAVAAYQARVANGTG